MQQDHAVAETSWMYIWWTGSAFLPKFHPHTQPISFPYSTWLPSAHWALLGGQVHAMSPWNPHLACQAQSQGRETRAVDISFYSSVGTTLDQNLVGVKLELQQWFRLLKLPEDTDKTNQSCHTSSPHWCESSAHNHNQMTYIWLAGSDRIHSKSLFTPLFIGSN